MLGRTPADQAALSRGYPHLILLTAPDPDDVTAAKLAKKHLDAFDPDGGVVWSRGVAARFARGLAEAGEFGIGIGSNYKDSDEGKAAAAAAERAGDIDEVTGRAIVHALVSSVSAYEWQGVRALYIVEQFIGGAAVLDAALAHWESTPANTWEKGPLGSAVAYALGFVAMRLDEAARAPYLSRARALIDASADAKSYVAEFLDLACNGSAGFERSVKHRVPGPYMMHFLDDPARVREVASEPRLAYQIDARHVVLGGEPVLDSLLANLKRVKAWRKLQLIDELAVLALPQVDAILRELAATKKLAPLAEAALAARGAKLRTSAKTKPAQPRAKPAKAKPAKAKPAKAKPAKAKSARAKPAKTKPTRRR